MRVILACCFLALMVGCSPSLGNRWTSVRGKVPVIPLPERPKLDKMTPEDMTAYRALPDPLKEKLESNNQKLQIYAEQLEVGTKEYNAYAKYNNAATDAELGVTPRPDVATPAQPVEANKGK
jgi:hypothetical protein